MTNIEKKGITSILGANIFKKSVIMNTPCGGLCQRRYPLYP
ncbi:MAG: hypothetical protein JWP67_393 [Mucilaginibacter sp.]|nr:hypothetical protein [Mucilaginibacter sp.]